MLRTPSPPPLKSSLCGVIDVLGFSDVVMAAYETNNQQAILDDLFNVLGESQDRITDAGKRIAKLDVRVLTDNIIVTHQNGWQAQLWDLRHLCEMLCDYQYLMARRGYFVRGGIACGTISVNERMVFGDALIKAHRLEQHVAKSPRIVIHPDLADMMRQKLAEESEPKRYKWSPFIREDTDGQLFVDYLFETWQPIRGKERSMEVVDKRLADHGDQVLRHLIQNKDDSNIRSKYLWCANYHNVFCDEVNKEHLKIDQSHLQS